jgi:hypothetical protein
MPLLDHFNPPLSQRRHWESFHSAWAEALARQLNEGLLPARYFAEAYVKVGSRVEIDVGTFEEANGTAADGGGVAVYAPPRPSAVAPLDFTHPDVFEVQILSEEAGPRLVAAVELVSPANKDRPAHRHLFAVKCASYLHAGVSVAVVDVVTERSGNLHRGVLEVLGVTAATQAQDPGDLYAAAYRTASAGEKLHLEMWVEPLALAATLPTLPLWIGEGQSVPLDLEQGYAAACAARRIG